MESSKKTSMVAIIPVSQENLQGLQISNRTSRILQRARLLQCSFDFGKKLPAVKFQFLVHASQTKVRLSSTRRISASRSRRKLPTLESTPSILASTVPNRNNKQFACYQISNLTYYPRSLLYEANRSIHPPDQDPSEIPKATSFSNASVRFDRMNHHFPTCSDMPCVVRTWLMSTSVVLKRGKLPCVRNGTCDASSVDAQPESASL